MCTNFEHVASLWFITGAPLLMKNWPLKLPLSIEILCNVNPTHHATVAPFKSTHCSGFGWFEPLCIWPKVFASLKNSWKVVKNQIRCVLKKLWNDIFLPGISQWVLHETPSSFSGAFFHSLPTWFYSEGLVLAQLCWSRLFGCLVLKLEDEGDLSRA